MSKSERFRRLAENRDEESTIAQKHEVIEKILGETEINLDGDSDGKILEQSLESVTNLINNEQLSVTVNSDNKNEQLDSSVLLNNKTEQLKVIHNKTTDNEQLLVSMKNNSDNKQLDGSVIINSDTEELSVTQKRKNTAGTRIPKPIEEFEKRLNKPTIEETHTRGTWLIRNDLLKRLDKLAKHQQRGFKTHIVNWAIEKVLDELEGNN